MPDPDPASWLQERSALDLLLGTEDGRLRIHLPNTPPPLVLIDRSVLTLVAHCAGLDHRNVHRPAFVERAAALLAADLRPCWPQAVLYLDVDHDVQLERNAIGKFADDSVFMDVSYNAGFREHFARMRAADDLPMAWIAGDATVDEVLEQAMVFLSKQIGVRSPST